MSISSFRHPWQICPKACPQGTDNLAAAPFTQAIDGWLLGSKSFVERFRQQVRTPENPDRKLQLRKLNSVSPEEVLTVKSCDVDEGAISKERNSLLARDIAALLARQCTTMKLRELAESLGPRHSDSVSNLKRRDERALETSPQFARASQSSPQATAVLARGRPSRPLDLVRHPW